jgi:hypothetical protein
VKAHIAAIIALIAANLVAIVIFTMPAGMSLRAHGARRGDRLLSDRLDRPQRHLHVPADRRDRPFENLQRRSAASLRTGACSFSSSPSRSAPSSRAPRASARPSRSPARSSSVSASHRSPRRACRSSRTRRRSPTAPSARRSPASRASPGSTPMSLVRWSGGSCRSSR